MATRDEGAKKRAECAEYDARVAAAATAADRGNLSAVAFCDAAAQTQNGATPHQTDTVGEEDLHELYRSFRARAVEAGATDVVVRLDVAERAGVSRDVARLLRGFMDPALTTEQRWSVAALVLGTASMVAHALAAQATSAPQTVPYPTMVRGGEA